MSIKQSLSLMLFMLASMAVLPQQTNHKQARVWFDGKEATQLAALGIDLTEGILQQNVSFTSIFSNKEIERIKNAGFRYDVLIDDMQEYYKQREKADKKGSDALFEIQKSSCAGNLSVPFYPVPGHFHLGSMGGFYTYQEMLDILDSMVLLYPTLISYRQPIDNTKSIEGRPLYYLKISDNPNNDEAEPEVLYTALHHSREPITLSQLIYYMWYLLENYDADNSIRALVDNTELYFVPCANPDGYLYNESTNPQGGGMWRKNRRQNPDTSYGVDLNRNYSYKWGLDDLGSSPYPQYETYRGASPFSEPEMQAIRNFCLNRNFSICFNYHSFGNHNIVPWDYSNTDMLPDSATFDFFATAVTKHNNYHIGNAYGTVGYMVNGGSNDWMYGEPMLPKNIFAMTPEIGSQNDHFWPPPNRIIPLCQENMYADFTLARLAGQYGNTSTNLPYYTNQQHGFIPYTFRLLGMDTSGQYNISVSAASANISSVGASHNIQGLAHLQSKTDSIAYTLSPSIQAGDEIAFAVTTTHGGVYAETDTIRSIYGTPVIAYNDPATVADNWFTNDRWGIENAYFHTPPSSFSDSPDSLYNKGDSSFFTLNKNIDLSGTTHARLSFYARWQLEAGRDYVQLQASSDKGKTWIPLCGKHTIKGYNMQPKGQPLYDGYQDEWVQEFVSLNDFLGKSIRIRFLLADSGWWENDGFYFDDLVVETVSTFTGQTSPDQPTASLSQPYPNPTAGNSTVYFNGFPEQSFIILYTPQGKEVWKALINEVSGNVTLPTDKLPAGLYLYRAECLGTILSTTHKLIVTE